MDRRFDSDFTPTRVAVFGFIRVHVGSLWGAYVSLRFAKINLGADSRRIHSGSREFIVAGL